VSRWLPGIGALLILGVASGFAGNAYAVDPPNTASDHVYIVDYNTGSVLYDKAGEEKLHPASMSKLMTIYLLFEAVKKGDIKLTDTFHVSKKAWSTQGSKMFVAVNSRVKVEDLVRGMIVQSGNDACVVLAEGLAGSEQRFAELMTERARQLGMSKSVFKNSTGLPDPDQVMTARDLATLAVALIRDFPQYYGFYSELNFVYNGIKQGNRNPLLYKNIGADGLKTGHTEAAGYGLTASIKRGDRRLILVINGMANVNARSREAERLLDWGFREFETVTIARAGAPMDEATVWLGTAPTVGLATDTDIAMTMPRPARKSLKVVVRYDDPIAAPVKAGQPVGRLAVSANETETKEYPLIAIADVPKLGFADRIMTAASYLVWGKAAR
jgi:D-alanyl-D-alanine carboxypeptidase (penicillin-binding protein 5/6)